MSLNYTVNFFCQAGWWIHRIHQAVSSFLNGCFVCKRLNAKHLKSPDPQALPSSRVNFSCLFAVLDVAFNGHLFVLDFFGNWQKFYLVIFTCFSLQAIHLETLSSMVVDDFLLTFVQFINQFGVPDELYSDNAKTFVSGASLLSNLITSSEFEHFRSFNIKFKTIPLYSPRWGAVWERLIGIIKSCISKTIGSQTISTLA